MDIQSASSNRPRNSGDEAKRAAVNKKATFSESSDDANEYQLSKLSIAGTSSASDKNKFKSDAPSKPSSDDTPKKKCVLEMFPWLIDIETSTHQCIGSVTEIKSKIVLNDMDFLLT